MRNINQHFLKLLILAGHLQSEKMKLKYPKNEFHHFVHHDLILFDYGDGIHFNFIFPFVLRELPKLFSEWEYNNTSVSYKPAPKLLNAMALAEFMGLTIDECCRLYIPAGQKTEDRLDAYSTPYEVGKKIMLFLEHQLIIRKNEHKKIRKISIAS